jgi:ComF family protein
MPILRTVLGWMADLAYPTACVHCNAFCDGSGPLCETCDLKLHQLSRAPACEQCALPLAQAGDPCPRCLGKGLYPYERVGRLCVYADPVRSVVKQFKYHRRWPLGEWLAERLLEKQGTRSLLKEIDLIVPVPLHRRRQFARGYNQARVIAGRIRKENGLKIASPVKRVRNTEQQALITNQKDRHTNVRDAFALVDALAVKGKKILVVDDVLTTGATLQAVGRTLLTAEPAALYGLVLAVADPRGRDFLSI